MDDQLQDMQHCSVCGAERTDDSDWTWLEIKLSYRWDVYHGHGGDETFEKRHNYSLPLCSKECFDKTVARLEAWNIDHNA
jgi:hypothetical protein